MKIEITRRELFIGLKDSLKLKYDQFFDKCIDFINQKYAIEIDIIRIKLVKLNSMKEQSRKFLSSLKDKYEKHNRHQQRLFDKEQDWLNSFAFVEEINDSEFSCAQQPSQPYC